MLHSPMFTLFPYYDTQLRKDEMEIAVFYQLCHLFLVIPAHSLAIPGLAKNVLSRIG